MERATTTMAPSRGSHRDLESKNQVRQRANSDFRDMADVPQSDDDSRLGFVGSETLSDMHPAASSCVPTHRHWCAVMSRFHACVNI